MLHFWFLRWYAYNWKTSGYRRKKLTCWTPLFHFITFSIFSLAANKTDGLLLLFFDNIINYLFTLEIKISMVLFLKVTVFNQNFNFLWFKVIINILGEVVSRCFAKKTTFQLFIQTQALRHLNKPLVYVWLRFIFVEFQFFSLVCKISNYLSL